MKPFAATKFEFRTERTRGYFGFGLVYSTPTNAINLLWDSIKLQFGWHACTLTRYRFFW